MPSQPAADTIIDVDIHPMIDPAHVREFLPQPWRMRYEMGNVGPGTLGYWNPAGVRRTDAIAPDGIPIGNTPQHLVNHFLQPNRIAAGILLIEPHQPLLSPEPDFAAAWARAVNDTLIQHWLPADARLHAAMHVSPTDVVQAVKEIHRVGDTPGIVEVFMPSGARMAYGSRYYWPIYEAACEHNLPVVIHPGTEGVGISGVPTAAGYPSSYFEWHTGLVGSYLAHLVSLVCEGVFQQFPTLKFVMLEGGVSWLPPILWRFDKNWKALRSTTPWLDRLPSEIAQEHILLSTQPIEEPANPAHLQQMLSMFDAGRMLMFSSDFPHWDGDTPDFAGRAFKGALRDRVMHQTARELYRLRINTVEGTQ